MHNIDGRSHSLNANFRGHNRGVVRAKLDFPAKIHWRQRGHGLRTAVGDGARLAPRQLETFVYFAELHIDDT